MAAFAGCKEIVLQVPFPEYFPAAVVLDFQGPIQNLRGSLSFFSLGFAWY